jgi:hypothetical protein
MNKHEFIVKETPAFKLKVRSWECASPKGLFSYEFVNEIIKDGEVVDSSTYNFFMTKEEARSLAEVLLK